MASKNQLASKKKTGKKPIELQDLQRARGGVTAEQARQVVGGVVGKKAVAKKKL